MSLQTQHLDGIRVVLRAIVEETSLDVPHAIIVLEDAMVACHFGLSLGLSLDRIYAQHCETTKRVLANAEGITGA